MGAASTARIPRQQGVVGVVQGQRVGEAQSPRPGQHLRGVAGVGGELSLPVVPLQPPVGTDVEPCPLVVQQIDRAGGHVHGLLHGGEDAGQDFLDIEG